MGRIADISERSVVRMDSSEGVATLGRYIGREAVLVAIRATELITPHLEGESITERLQTPHLDVASFSQHILRRQVRRVLR